MEIQFYDYIVNDCGINDKTVYSLKRKKFLKPCLSNTGYYVLALGGKRYTLHRLIATLFIPNPQDKPCIDHINGDRTDNRVENLRWCTYKENNNNPIYIERKVGQKRSDRVKQKMSESRKGKKFQKLSDAKKGIIPKANPPKQVYQYTLDGELVKVWKSTMECQRNGFTQSKVSQCCRGERKTHKGYVWKYASI